MWANQTSKISMRVTKEIDLQVAKFFQCGFLIEIILVFLSSSIEVIGQSQPLTDEKDVGWRVNYDEKDIMWALGDEEMISIATGHSQPVSKAPSVATVITAEDIKAMGAIQLSEVLESVPGLHVSRRAVGYNPKFLIRGIETEFNPQVLVLINGIPITNIFHGDRNQVWGGMPIEAISRVEVIRGPGSAIYGADAFSGVINIITKTIQDLPTAEFGLRHGSFSTNEIWFVGGETWKGFDVVFSFEYHETEGHERKIKEDQQTLLDRSFQTSASLAPGPVNLGIKSLDTRLDVARGDWRLRAGLQKRWDGEIGVGIAQALDPSGEFASDRWNVDLTYHNSDFADTWDVQAQFSFLDTSQEVDRNAIPFPSGSIFPIQEDGNLSRDFSDELAIFPEGVIANPEVFERNYRFEFSAFYTAFENHRLRLGTGINYSEVYKVRNSANFGPGVIDADALPTGDAFPQMFFDPSCSCIVERLVSPINRTLTDTSDTPNSFLPEENRKNVHVFAQDEWSFANDWTLTMGIRYDYYSDFGNTVNPRIAVIWATTHNFTTKFLYGQSFRAPAFAELFERNNPATLGNNDLDPETIDTVEIALDYRPQTDWRWNLNLFYYEWDDIIRFVPNLGTNTATAQNSGKQNGYGLELETDWQLMDDLRLIGNYAFQQSEDEQSNDDAGNAPKHQVYLRAEWEFIYNWTLSSQMNWVIDRDRPPGDSRSDIDDYAIVDLTLRRRNIIGHLEIAVSVRNLFDVDAREPSPSGTVVAIPNDLPLADRSIFVEARFLF